MNGLNLLSNPLGWLARDWDSALGEGQEAWMPTLDIREDAERFTVEVDAPGMRHEDIGVTFSDDRLVLRGQRKAEAPEGSKWHRRERGTGSFERTVTFPVAVDAGKIEASFKDGVLTITLPKSEAAKPRKVEVKYLERN